MLGLRPASAKRSTTNAQCICGWSSQQWAVSRISSESSKRRRRTGSLEQIAEVLLVLLGEGGDDGFLARKVAIDQADANAGLGADVVHAGLVEPAFGEANHRGAKDLRPPVERGVSLGRHASG